MRKIYFYSSPKEYALVDEEDYSAVSQYTWHVRKGYAVTGKKLSMHRLIMDAPDNKEVDHINHNRLDNRKINLRLCSHAENLRNSAHRHTNKSGFTGVSWHKASRKWRAYIQCEGKLHHLGLFTTALEAAVCRNNMARKLHGDFARIEL